MRALCGLSLVLVLLVGQLQAETGPVSIDANYPGGNVIVVGQSEDRVELAPDLRGGKPWFYWNFEATAAKPGRITFAFAGAAVGVSGPAVSFDEGVSWHWLGYAQVTYDEPVEVSGKKFKRDSFFYDFKADQLKVRFAMAMPYLHRDLEAFLKQQTDNPHLTRNVLARTLKGTPVTLLTVGQPRPEVPAMLLTARHHACESMASYVLEGFVAEAISDSPCAVDFRNRYTLQVVPIVDVDGVEAGDQGKWRDPHDHNRDYGETPLYPEVKAIQELAAAQKVTYALDVHCPALRGDVHEAFYFDGLALPHITGNVNELIGWIREERPPAAGAPLNFMKPPKGEPLRSGLPFSHYFAGRPEMVFAATLEVPYTQRPNAFDADMARRYGAKLLKAWTRTRFLAENADPSLRKPEAYEAFMEARTTFQRSFRGQPQTLYEKALSVSQQVNSTSVSKMEAELQLAMIELHQKEFLAALEHCGVVTANQQATTQQQAAANKLRLAIVCNDPAATSSKVEAALEQALHFPDPAHDYLAESYERVSLFFEQQADFELALRYAREQLTVVPNYRYGNTLLRIATLLEQLKRPDEASATRQQAVENLQAALNPPPRSIFGALMTIDLFDALVRLPSATLAEKQAAAKLVLEHAVTPTAAKEKVKKAIEELEAAQQ